ncbi:hypothetical protein N826_26895 [Skermanella aerolata KACC 11604]|nr:hypothetical protein N826_26895 [Skermanella aerolata KACC 11604]
MVCCAEPSLALKKMKAKRAKPPYINVRIFVSSYMYAGLVLGKFNNRLAK